MVQPLKARFPRTIGLKGRTYTLRPLEKGDEHALLAYFKRLPVDERQMLKDDVTDASVIRAWCQSIDYASVMPLLAFLGEQIVGNTTLHRSRGWSSHVAKIRITLDPLHRGVGLGTALVQEILEAAHAMGVAIVDAEAMAEQTAAIRMLEKLDFVTVATLSHHVLDLTHQPHDLVLLSRTLTTAERLSPDAAPAEVDHGGGG